MRYETCRQPRPVRSGFVSHSRRLSRKATLPVLSNVLLEADDDGKLRVAATDLDVTYDGYLSCWASNRAVTVDGKRLYEIIRRLPGEEVDIEVNQMRGSRFGARTRNSFSLVPALTVIRCYQTPTEANLIPIDGVVFRELIERTMTSTSTDE